jgi:small-conductance mechanosensitive channel
MKWSLEVMRRGMAEYALPREMAVTQGLNQMRDRVREAQGALDRQQPGGQDVESALARAEQLRQQLEQMRNGASQKDRQGQTPSGQSGQTSQSQGSPSATGSPAGGIGIDSAYADRVFRNGARDLTQLDQMLRGNPDVPRETSRDVQDLVRQMQRLDPRLLAADPTRLDQIVGQLLGAVEQVELELRRVADAQQSGSVRSGASQPVPPGYADAVAEYFRRLAAQK